MAVQSIGNYIGNRNIASPSGTLSINCARCASETEHIDCLRNNISSDKIVVASQCKTLFRVLPDDLVVGFHFPKCMCSQVHPFKCGSRS